ncbi:MAG: DUF1343 domain-containing protein [Bacteroidales bacterium]|nr:DUF1343 domain-containing protein [Bacteroidales bacterium]
MFFCVKIHPNILLAALLVFLPGCLSARVRPGIEVLEDMDFAPLKGRKVALLTNQTGTDGEGHSTISILHSAPGVKLVALFGPEHGIRGDIKAGDPVRTTRDAATGLPVYSLYDRYRQPTAKMLEGVDVLVYDIQDVGTRSYTFISTLGLAMRTCAEAGVEVMVLDRPNPLGGRKIEGCYVEKGYNSFISQYRIPYVYGLTVGELATLINEEGLNCGQRGDLSPLKCALTVIPMEGWHRDMLYSDTDLRWIPTSPAIPNPESAIGYPSAGILGDIHGFLNIGMNCGMQFCVFGAQWIDSRALADTLNSRNIPGTHFEPLDYTSTGRWKTEYHGVRYIYDDYDSACITLTQFHVMEAISDLYPDKRAFEVCTECPTFDKVCGTSRIRARFAANYKVASIRGYWMKDVEHFKHISEKYHLYE